HINYCESRRAAHRGFQTHRGLLPDCRTGSGRLLLSFDTDTVFVKVRPPADAKKEETLALGSRCPSGLIVGKEFLRGNLFRKCVRACAGDPVPGNRSRSEPDRIRDSAADLVATNSH